MNAPIPGVLDDTELRDVQSRFGVDADQVRRDHVISHALAVLSSISHDHVVFFGGTALSRTLLPDLRLSEDIDLIALASRTEVGAEIQGALTAQLRGIFRTPAFTPDIASAAHPDTSVMTVGDVRVQIQLLSSAGYPRWPTEVHDLEQRYSDAPPARMRVLTPPAFAAAKLAAWVDRGAARDLYDMWALAELGAIDDEAKQIFGKFGPLTSSKLAPFVRIPSPAQWNTALQHQGIVRVSAHEAAEAVRKAWQ